MLKYVAVVVAMMIGLMGIEAGRMTLFSEKSTDGILEELIRYLPFGRAWRGASIREGGAFATGKLAIQGGRNPAHPPFTSHFIEAGAIFVDPITGAQFSEITGSEVEIEFNGSAFTLERQEIQPGTGPEFGTLRRALATMDETPPSMEFEHAMWQTGSNMVIASFSGNFDPVSPGEDAIANDVRYIRGSAEAGARQFSYALDDPTDDPVPEDGGGQTAHSTIKVIDIIALEKGTLSNLVDDRELVLKDPADDRNAHVHLMRTLSGTPMTGGEDPRESLIRKLLRALSHELRRAHDLLRQFADEIPGVDPATTTATSPGRAKGGTPSGMVKLLPEWEKAVGIPDDCFPGTGTLDERRRHVFTKLASLGVQTSDDFEALALLFGVVIQCQPGLESPLFPADLSAADARFTVVITFFVHETVSFTYTFLDRDPPPGPEDGLLFVESQVVILECLFAKLIPANCQLRFLYDQT